MGFHGFGFIIKGGGYVVYVLVRRIHESLTGALASKRRCRIRGLPSGVHGDSSAPQRVRRRGTGRGKPSQEKWLATQKGRGGPRRDGRGRGGGRGYGVGSLHG